MATSVVPAGAIVLEVLNNQNYVDWSVLVENYLLSQDLWDVVEISAHPDPTEEADEFKVWRKKNATALHTIQISCGLDAFSVIRDIRSAKIAWDTLEEKFKRQSLLAVNSTVQSSNSPNNPGYDTSGDAFHQYEPFFDAVRSGDWNKAREFLDQRPHAVRARIPDSNKTALYLATELGHEHIVEKLVELMEEEDLGIKSFGWTALAVAANRGIMKMVECMVRKSKKILSIATDNNMTPILLASGHWDVVRYLYSVTPPEEFTPEKGPYGAGLVCRTMVKQYDIAKELIQGCPKLLLTRDPYGVSPVHALAFMPTAFPSGTRLKFWQRWIYNCIHIEPTRVISDIRVSVQNEGNEEGNRRNMTWSGVGSLQGLLWNLLELLGINRIREMKLIHSQTHELLDRMCEVIKHSNEKEMEDVYDAMFRAVERGIFEYVDRICQACPNLMWRSNRMNKNVFQFAIECRQEKIYSLIYRLDKRKRSVIGNFADNSNNSMLHVAGMVSPLARLEHISGAALQMQRELQWFKEVETIVRIRDSLNAEYLTPRSLFTRHHKELVKEGERWMKETATSCTVVGALIITIMFASAFTVPGGNNGETGIPIFLKKKLFMAFMVSDAIALFSSTTSVLMFLGILTSRYAEDDFLVSLPTKMIIGLSTLFFSIAAMMVAFSSGLFIMTQEKLWIVIPFIFLASVPVTLFIGMQFPLLVEIFISTYGGGIFDRKGKLWI